jgi:hypothetical protein
MSQELRCPRCEDVMEEGFLLDNAHLGGFQPSRWVGGKPEYGLASVKLEMKKLYQLQAYRCIKCGYVEIYAPHSP